MYGLKIHLLSFVLDQNIINIDDKIRLSITTIPEGCKEKYEMSAMKLRDAHHYFSINITEQTNKIIFVIRRKSFLQNDPIIASTIVYANQFPSPDNSKNSDVQMIKLFEPLQTQKYCSNVNNRKVVGQMEIQFAIVEPEHAFNSNIVIEKIHKGQGYSKVKVVSQVANENENQNYSIIND